MQSLRTLTPHVARRAFSTSTPRALARMQIIGRLGADPELIATSTGTNVIRYSIGTSFGPKDNRETSWFRVASFATGPQQEYILGLQKGTQVYVDADSRMRTYEDADGKKVMRLELVQRNIEVLHRPYREAAEEAQSPGSAEEAAAASQ